MKMVHFRNASIDGRCDNHDADGNCLGHEAPLKDEEGREVPVVAAADVVCHPKHYNSHESGVEIGDIAEGFCWNLGNAVTYIWRADHKGSDIVDLAKAIVHIEREIERRQHGAMRYGKEGRRKDG